MNQIFGCVISFFYIKPQLFRAVNVMRVRCVISFFYIKPQPHGQYEARVYVVLYPSSTSNHNFAVMRI